MTNEEALAILSASKDIALTQLPPGDKNNKMFVTALPEPDPKNRLAWFDDCGVWSSTKSLADDIHL